GGRPLRAVRANRRGAPRPLRRSATTDAGLHLSRVPAPAVPSWGRRWTVPRPAPAGAGRSLLLPLRRPVGAAPDPRRPGVHLSHGFRPGAPLAAELSGRRRSRGRSPARGGMVRGGALAADPGAGAGRRGTAGVWTARCCRAGGLLGPHRRLLRSRGPGAPG